MREISKLAVHTITTKSWNLETAIEKYAKKGIRNISIWRQYLEGLDLNKIRSKIDEHNMNIISLVRGGFFPYPQKEKREAGDT